MSSMSAVYTVYSNVENDDDNIALLATARTALLLCKRVTEHPGSTLDSWYQVVAQTEVPGAGCVT